MNYAATERAADFYTDRMKRRQDDEAEELEMGDLQVWVAAESIAHDDTEIEALTRDGDLCLADIKVKVGGRFIGADQAIYRAVLRYMAGRHDEADCIARDSINEIAKALEPMVRSRRVTWEE